MSTERDSTRIVQSWLEAGSTAIPDRVLDAVLAELPSRRQRRPRWSLWRSARMKPIVAVAAGAAVVLLAVVLGTQYLPGTSSGIGGPKSSPSPSPTPMAVGGHFVFGDNWPVDIDATSDGTSLSGTVVGDYYGTEFNIDLQCLRQFDDQTWMLAGVATKSADRSRPDGSWAVVIVRDGAPQQAGIYLEAASTADDCEEFVSEVSDVAVEGRDMIGDMSEGSITLPPAPAASPAS